VYLAHKICPLGRFHVDSLLNWEGQHIKWCNGFLKP
jgi:hypothetical protein